MPTPDITQGYNEYIEKLKAAGTQRTNALNEANQQWLNQNNAMEAARQAGAETARNSLQKSFDEGIGGIDAILREGRELQNAAEREANDQRRSEQKAALWTGAGEVAAAIANLVAVGGHNASPQQYKLYSQDWMRQAEENWRQNRARIDNMRERQRALQQQMIQMKMNKGATLANFDMSEANARAAAAGRRADAGLKFSTDIAGINAQTDQAVAQAGLQGVQAKTSLAMEQDRLNEQRRQFDETMQLKLASSGIKKEDGKFVLDKNSELYKALQSGGKSGSTKKDAYPFYDSSGNMHYAYMTSAERTDFIKRASGELSEKNETYKGAISNVQDQITRQGLTLKYAEMDDRLFNELMSYSNGQQAAAAPKSDKDDDKSSELLGADALSANIANRKK